MAKQEYSDVSISDSELITNVEQSMIQQKQRSSQRVYTPSTPTGEKKAITRTQAPTAKAGKL